MALLLALLAVAIMFAIGGIFGAPYLPIMQRDCEPLLDLSGLEAGQTLIDLGSGDGQLLRAAARRGIRGIGYEINPMMVLVSRLVCWRYRHLVTIQLANFWDIKLPPANAVYVFLIPRLMRRLDQKLAHEISQPTTVISYIFEVPGRLFTRHQANAFMYTYPYPPLTAQKKP